MTKDKTFTNFLKLSKGEHSLEEVIKLVNTEVNSVFYNKAEDGLRKPEFEEDYTIDYEDKGVPTLLTKE